MAIMGATMCAAGRCDIAESACAATWDACHAGGVRLLVVEDEARLAAALQRGLQAEGFAVDVAADGPTGPGGWPGTAATTR